MASSVDKSGNLALLIDADNISPNVRRIYGDWTSPTTKGWKACLLDHSILPIQQFAYTSGKNATDGAMIIDAMDLLYTNRFSSFCLVSSDSDFTRLAARIREQGVMVYGFGERKTHPAFVNACNQFVYLDVLNVPVEPDEPHTVPSTPSARPPPPAIELPHRPSVPMRSETPQRPLDRAALAGLAQAIQNSATFEGDYANLAEVGHYLRKISPDLTHQNYGYGKLREFVEASQIADLKVKPMGNNPPVVLARLKEEAKVRLFSPLGYVPRP